MTDSLFYESAEYFRLQKMMVFEKKSYEKGYKTIVGVDEAGRGPLAGPVVAAACVLPVNFMLPSINDSKKLNAKVRHHLFQQLITHPHISYGVGLVDAQEIDRVNIYQATIQAMQQAIKQLSVLPDILLVDGLMLPHTLIPCIKIIKGDQISQSIAAASIIAKETRDQLMCQYEEQWPLYGFKKHKGYGTKTHLEALRKYGPCPIHRQSFEPIKTQIFLKQEVLHD